LVAHPSNCQRGVALGIELGHQGCVLTGLTRGRRMRRRKGTKKRRNRKEKKTCMLMLLEAHTPPSPGPKAQA